MKSSVGDFGLEVRSRPLRCVTGRKVLTVFAVFKLQTAGSGAGAARIDAEQQRTALSWAAGKLRDHGERAR